MVVFVICSTGEVGVVLVVVVVVVVAILVSVFTFNDDLLRLIIFDFVWFVFVAEVLVIVPWEGGPLNEDRVVA